MPTVAREVGKISLRFIRILIGCNFLLLVSAPFTTNAFAENVLYFTGDGKIRRAAIDGSGTVVDVVTSGVSAPLGITVDIQAEKIYWTDAVDLNIRKANLDGTGVEEIINTGDISMATPMGMDIDAANNKIYWVDFGDETINRADRNGDNPVTLASIGTRLMDLAVQVTGGVDDGFIYYTTRSGTEAQKVQRRELDGSNLQNIIALTPQARGIDLDLTNGKVYWTSSGGGSTVDRILRANLSPGSAAEVFLDLGIGDSVFDGLTLDLGTSLSDSFVYFSDLNTAGAGPAIHRASLDGNTTDLNFITGINGVRHLEIGPAPSQQQEAIIPELPPGSFGFLAFFTSGLILLLRKRIDPRFKI